MPELSKAAPPVRTVLLIRSSTLPHCLSLFQYLREVRYPAGGVRWFWIIQPAVETEVRHASEGLDAVFLVYDRPRFQYQELKRLFLDRLREEKVDEAYVPYNNPDGRGYGDIIRFLSEAGATQIISHLPVRYFDRITWSGYLAFRIWKSFLSAFVRLLVVCSLPFILVYYALRAAIGRSQQGSRSS